MAFSSPNSTTNNLPYLKEGSIGSEQTYRPQPGVKGQKIAMSDQELRNYRLSGQNRDKISPASKVSFSNVNNSFRPNSNPISTRGTAQVTLEDGNTLTIPNALAQQLMNQEKINKGRYSAGEMFDPTKDQTSQINGTIYKDYGASQSQLNQFTKNNPQYSGSGFVNPYQEKISRLQSIDDQINQLNSQLYNGVRREVVNSSGQAQSNDYEYTSKMASLNKERLSLPSVSRGDRVRADRGDELIQDLLRKKFAPAVSNLPIKETVIQ